MIPLVAPLAMVDQYCQVFADKLAVKDLPRLKRYLSGLIVNPNKTIEGINKLFILDFEDQSTLNRFLTNSSFDVTALNAARVEWMQSCAQTSFKKAEGSKGVLVLDDTLLTHYGEHFEKAAWLYDHVSDSYCWSHCLVNLHYSDDLTDYPIDFRLWEPADSEEVEKAMLAVGFKFKEEKLALKTQDTKTWRSYLLQAYNNKRKTKSGQSLQVVYKTKIDYACELLEHFFSIYPQHDLPVAFDPWYTCAELCSFIDQKLKKSYVGTLCDKDILLIGSNKKEMRCDEFVKILKQQQQALKNGEKPLFEKIGIHYKGQKEHYWAYCKTHHVKNLGQQRLVISFSKEDLSDSEPKYYISNRLHWRSGGILRIRRHRWPIEVYHEEGKAQGLDQYQLRQFEAVKKHIACVCLAYSMLKRVQFDTELLNKLKWNPQRKTGSLAFWRRVMTANALMAFVEWVVHKLPDKQPFDHVIQKLVQVYT